ncbi:MAG: addiction module protein [Bergeyella sp.]
MKTQEIQDHNGVPTGVFIPIKEWEKIKSLYPDIDSLEDELPDWEKDFIDQRLEAIAKNPERLQPIEKLFEELNRKI